MTSSVFCEKCNVTVRGNYSRCPLCQQPLAGEAVDGIFPHVKPHIRRLKKIMRLAAFFSIVSVVTCVALNVAFPSYGWWSVFVIAGLASLWLSLGVLINKMDNIYKAIVWQVVLISVLALVWDVFTGFRGWSVDFVIPILCTASMAALAVIAQAARLNLEDYVIYLVIDAVWGILCILLIIFNIAEIIIPSLICVAVSVISLSALYIFAGQALKAELKRRLHL